MKIHIDNREREKVDAFQEYLNRRKSAIVNGIETGNYQVGDYHSGDGLVGIERKKTDYIRDVFSGKLDQQLKELRDNFEYPFLFIDYPSISDLISDCLGVNPQVVIGSLTSILARHKVSVMFVGGMFVPFTVRMMEKFYDGKTQPKETDYIPIRRKASSSEIKRAMFENVFPGLGKAKVNALFVHFNGSFKDIINADVEELMKVKGIGRKIAENMVEVFK